MRVMFTPIRTERLLIRPFRLEDAAGLAERRNDPTVAKYQNWLLPFTTEQAEKIVSEVVASPGLVEIDSLPGELAHGPQPCSDARLPPSAKSVVAAERGIDFRVGAASRSGVAIVHGKE